MLLQKYRNRNGKCITILFKSIGVRGRFDSSDTAMLNIAIQSGAGVFFAALLGSDDWYTTSENTTLDRKLFAGVVYGF